MNFLQRVGAWFQPAPKYTGPISHTLRCPDSQGSHRMAYTSWGDPENPRVLVCVHGLTRNGRDFDYLAQALCDHYRVICPDVVGRGKSAWLVDKSAYAVPQYVSDMLVLLARLDVERVDWLGTSMGGLIGMYLGAQIDSPIRRMVLNDVGPVITRSSLQRIAGYVCAYPDWASLEEAEAYARQVSAPFGQLDAVQWRRLTQYWLTQGENGRWHFNYDPEIAQPFRQAFLFQNVELWPVYEALRCPVLAIRGAESDLLTREAWEAMGSRGPRARLAEVPEVGHAPMFQTSEQIQLVREFLLQA